MTTFKRIGICLIALVLYVSLSALLIGFKMQQVYFGAFVGILYVLNRHTRTFMLCMAPFVIFWILFDYMKAIPNYEVSKVHIGDVYDLDKKYFGIYANGKLNTPNEFWQQHTYKILDFFTGLFYLCWMPIPLLFATLLIYTRRKQALLYTLCFLFVNFIGWAIYYGFPAAPPWYMALYGNVFNPHTPGNVAGLARFDNLLHVTIFNGLYSQSSNVFAAMPSLHSAYPIVTFYFGLKNRIGKVKNILLGIIMVGIWFSAIYTNHHYVIDVIAGISCAIIGIFIFEKFIVSSNRFNRFINKYYSLVQ